MHSIVFLNPSYTVLNLMNSLELQMYLRTNDNAIEIVNYNLFKNHAQVIQNLLADILFESPVT